MAKHDDKAPAEKPAIKKEKTKAPARAGKKKDAAAKRVQKAHAGGSKKEKRKLSGRRVASSVKSATVKSVKWFNWYTFSQGGESHHTWLRIPLTFRFFIKISVVIIIMMILALDNQSVTVNQQSLSMAGLPADLEGYRILLVSDLHAAEFGNDQSTLLRVVNAQKYDIMVIVGDMVGVSGDYGPFLQFLNGLNKTSNVYFIAGDSDPGPFRAEISADDLGEKPLSELVLEEWIVEAMATGANYVNLPTAVAVGNNGAQFWLTPANEVGVSIKATLADAKEEYETVLDGMLSGIGVDYTTLPFAEYRYRLYMKLSQLVSQMSADDLNIVLSHVPPENALVSVMQDDHSDTVNDFLNSPDIILAGHYCGGVWRVPRVGAFYIPEPLIARNGWAPPQSYVRGMRTVGNTLFYVTAGLGKTDDVLLPFRLFNTPEVCLLTLTASLDENTLIG